VPLIALKDTGLEPHPDKPEDARIGDPVRQHSQQHSWSTESKKLRMSASSTQFTRWLMIAVCSDDRAWCGLRPGRKP
jgi:hypothetical protein